MKDEAKSLKSKWAKRKQITLLHAALTLIMVGVGPVGCKHYARISNDTGYPEINAALAAQSKDEIKSLLSVEASFSPSIKTTSGVDGAVILDDRSIVLLDTRMKSVAHYSPDGHLIGRFGAEGSAPTEYRLPSAITGIENGIAIADFIAHRVLIFNAHEQPQASFIYSRQQFSASQIAYLSQGGVILLYGNKWQDEDSSGHKRALLLNKYQMDGTYQGSLFPLPPQFSEINLFGEDQAFISRDPKTKMSSFSLPFSYGVYTLDESGNPKLTTLESPQAFRAPTATFDASNDQNRPERYAAWRKSWTPIAAGWRRGNYVYIQYETWSPLKYTVDVWDASKKSLLRSVHTNYRFVSSSGAKDVFVQDIQRGKKNPELVIGEINDK